MKEYIKKSAHNLKVILLDPIGWLSWIIANVITSLVWFVPLAIGFVLNDTKLYAISGAIWLFMMNPLTPFWLLNLLIATFFYKKIFNK